MLGVRLTRKGVCIALTAVIVLLFMAVSPVLAQYLYRAPFTISETSGTDYTAIGVNCSADVDWLITNGFITTSTALDTRIETLGGTEQLHMMASDRIMAFCPTLNGYSQLNWYLTTGNTALDDFPVITGYGGSVVIADAVALELGNSFNITFNGWVDLSTYPYPIVEATNSSVETAPVTSHDVNMPSGMEAGDLLILFFDAVGTVSNNPTISWPTGWTELHQDGDSYDCLGIAYKVANSTEANPIIVTTSQSKYSAHMTYRISNYVGVPDYSVASGTSANPNPPSHTSSGGSSLGKLWIAAWLDDDWGRSTNAYPTGYSNGFSADAGSYAACGSASRQSVVGTENPGTFTISASSDWEAYTISVTGATSPLVAKADAFTLESSDPTTGDMIASILDSPPVNVTIPGPTATVHEIGIWADGTTFGVDVDGVTENSTALGGASVPNNSNSWRISMPYFTCYNHTVNGTLIAHYQPVSLISGTTLPDREGTAQNGAITWGANPSGVSVVLGSLTVPASTASVSEEGDVFHQTTHTAEVSDWFLEPAIGTTLATHPLRPLITIMSNGTTVTEVQAWRFLGLALVLLVTVVAAVMLRGHLLIAGLACAGTIALLVQQTVWPGWALVLIIPAIVAGIMAERTPSIG